MVPDRQDARGRRITSKRRHRDYSCSSLLYKKKPFIHCRAAFGRASNMVAVQRPNSTSHETAPNCRKSDRRGEKGGGRLGCSPFLGPLEMGVLSNKLNTSLSTYISTMSCSPLITGSTELVRRRISQ